MASMAEELRQQLEEEKENSRKMQEDLEVMKIRDELEMEKRKQQQWQVAMEQLKENRDKAEQEHSRVIQELKDMATTPQEEVPESVTEWLKARLVGKPLPTINEEEEKAKRERMERERQVKELKAQQEQISKQLVELQGTTLTPEPVGSTTSQDTLLQQLRSALLGKKEEDPNKVLLKALITTQNKAGGEGGTNTLKPNIFNSILTPEMGTNMADWFANLNRQEGEFDVSKLASMVEGEGKPVKVRSGILDKATTNIQVKQIWPQQNLGEDWADEDVEFKQIKFEHLVAGETHTIETCTDPAQILGRLRLLHRIAYLKLRGYEWHLIRKMYAAILTSIKTKEYSWESNFDRFETILYRQSWVDSKSHTTDSRGTDKEGGGRKHFCRDFNKPEGCPKNSPHTVWFGSGPGASKRLVYHYWAACLIRDKQAREHPEGHPDCPHKD